jgi:mannose-6-phosphate isomerase-like protein (cupin superfamily)
MIGGEKRGGTPPLLQKFRTPCQISQLDGTKILRKSESNDHNDSSDDEIHGTHLELVSPDWALSSNLYCDVVTLPPGTELVSKNAEGVEFYYVMKGDGIYVDQHGEKHEITADDGFIVDTEW